MATETLPELLPCPFCGGTNLEFHLYPGGCPDGFIQCSDCTTCGPESEATHEAAAASWNAREAVPADADALEKAMRLVIEFAACRVDLDRSRDSGSLAAMEKADEALRAFLEQRLIA